MPRKIIGWKVRNPPKPQPVAPEASKPETAEQRQRREWRTQVEEVERNAPALPWPTEDKGPGLLDDVAVDQKKDPEGWSAVVLERLRRLNN